MALTEHIEKYFSSPRREYVIAPILALVLIFDKLLQGTSYAPFMNNTLWVAALLGALPLASVSLRQLWHREITIEVFNLFALIVALVLNHPAAAVWIDLMLTFAAYLEWRTKARSSNAIEELLRLRPEVAHLASSF